MGPRRGRRGKSLEVALLIGQAIEMKQVPANPKNLQGSCATLIEPRR